MIKLNESLENAQNSRINEIFNSISSIKVLVIDHKKEFLAYVADVLHSCSFKVTCVDNSRAALRLISEKKNEFDLLLIDSDMGDIHIHTFLKLTRNIDALSIVMSEQENDTLLLEAIQNGAFLVVKRPVTIEAIRHIRQDVIRERMHKYEICKKNNMVLDTAKQETAIHENKSLVTKYSDSRKQVSRLNFDNNQVYQCSENEVDFGSMRKKICVEWTDELHEKFLNAVSQLGEGRCYPKEILNLMGVPGLTRMQVASHLQKCRKEKWKYDEKRCMLTPSWKHKMTEINERKFGCMPSLQTDHSSEEENNTLIGFNLSINGWKTGVNHLKNQTYKDSSMMQICNQKNTEQRSLYTPIPFGSGFGTKRDEGFGKIITKTSNNYFQQSMSGLHDAEQGSSDRRQDSDDFPDFLKDLDGNGPNDI